MFSIIRTSIEISVSDDPPHIQAPFMVSKTNRFREAGQGFSENVRIGEKSTAYFKLYDNEITYILNYREAYAKMIKAWMVIEYSEPLETVNYVDGKRDRVYSINIKTPTKMNDIDGITGWVHWDRIGHVSNPEGIKTGLRFNEHELTTLSPHPLDQINFYKKHDCPWLEFAWIWKRGSVPHGTYELKIKLSQVFPSSLTHLQNKIRRMLR